MRRWLWIVGAATLALAAAGVVGVAGAVDPAATTSARLVTVNGSASANVPPGTSEAATRAAYSTALGNALDNAKAKADLVAQKTGVTLGPVQSVTENSDVSTCDAIAVPYQTGRGAAPKPRATRIRPVPPAVAPAPAPPPSRAVPSPPSAVRGRGILRAVFCPLSAQVTVSYQIP